MSTAPMSAVLIAALPHWCVELLGALSSLDTAEEPDMVTKKNPRSRARRRERKMRNRITDWHLRVTADAELARFARRLAAELAARRGQRR